MNIVALSFWIFCGIVGYLIGGSNWALGGIAISMGLSILATIF